MLSRFRPFVPETELRICTTVSDICQIGLGALATWPRAGGDCVGLQGASNANYVATLAGLEPSQPN